MGSFLRRLPRDMKITIVGLGPAGTSHVDEAAFPPLTDAAATVVLRTRDHPAAEAIATLRPVITCDDLYDTLSAFDDVYAGITDRVVAATADGSVVYAVPGSAVVGERTVPMIIARAEEAGIPVTVIPGASFLDLAYVAVGVDPIADGLQVLDARDLPDPLPLHVPTFITQVDSALRASDVSLALSRTVDPESPVVILDRLGDHDALIEDVLVADLARYDGGPRTTVFVPATLSGLLGLVTTNRLLREQCPWDKKQTHHTLLTHLVEETYETADAISRLPIDAPGGDIDYGAYAEVEEELGDLLLQVVFHATLASEAGAFDIDEVAEHIRRKLVERHPHVFGSVSVDGPDEVLANWEEIKQVEKNRDSLMDDIPSGMTGIARAMKVQRRARSVGFDWDDPEDVIAVLRSEIDEFDEARPDDEAMAEELGDILFTAVNLARHVGVDPEIALRGSVDTFIERFRHMEASFERRSVSMRDASLEDLEVAWTEAKSAPH